VTLLDAVIDAHWATLVPPAVVPDQAMHREMDVYITDMSTEDRGIA